MNAFTLSGVNTGSTPGGFGNQANASTVAVSLSSTAAGSMAVSIGGWRMGGVTPFSFTASSGPNPTIQWGPLAANAASASSIGAVGGYLANLSPGALTLTQSNNATSRNDLAVAVFSALFSGLNWSGATNSNRSLSGSDVNWTNTSGTSSYSDGSSVFFSDSGANTNPINIAGGGVSPFSVTFVNNAVPYSVTGGPIAGTTSVVISGGGLVAFSNSNTYSGPTMITSGTLQIGNGGSLGSISTSSPITDNGTLVFSRSDTVTQGTNFSGGAITGNGALVQAGIGTLLLNAANSYSGGTKVTAGTLTVGTAGALGATTGALNVSNPNTATGTAVVLNLATGASTTTGPLSGSIAAPSSGANTATINTGGSGLNFTVNQTAAGSYAGSIAGAGNFTLGSSGTNTLVLAGADTYSGTTGINAGTLQFATPASLYNANTGNWTAANITVSNSATLAVNLGGPNDFSATQAAALLANLSAVSSNGLKAGASFGIDTTNSTTAVVTASTPLFANGVNYSTPIADSTGTGGGALGFTKLGTGTLVLSASNGYSGRTSVLSGELVLQGTNSGTGTLNATNTAVGGLTVLSIRSSTALGSGTANSSLPPISLNATGTLLSTSILEIGATIGTDPGGHNADFSYQVIASGNNG